MPGISHIGIRSGIGIGRSSGSYWNPLNLPSTVTVENAAPTNIVLTYDKKVNPVLPDKNKFQITDHIVSSITLDVTGKILTIVLSNPVIYFDILTLAISVDDTINFVSITNNVLDDGLTIAAYDRTIPANVLQTGGVEKIYWDIMKGSTLRGAEESSGTTVAYGVYEITATEANHFFTGCVIGDLVTDITPISLNANNKVKRVTGNHLSQPYVTKRPVNGVFDAINDFIKTAVIADLIQPEFIYIVFRQLGWTSANFIFDGGTLNKMQLSQYLTSAGFIAYAGSVSGEVILTVGKWGLIRVKFNGASSSLQKNKEVAVTGDFGASNGLGFTLGASGANGSYGKIEFMYCIIRNSADNATIQNSIYNSIIRKLKIFTPTGRDFTTITRYVGNPIIVHNTHAWNHYGQDTVYPKLECKIGNTYYALSQVDEVDGLHWNNFALYTSTDLINWTAYGVVFSARPGEYDASYLAHPSVIKIGSTFYMYYSALNGASKQQIGLATSTDFINWTRVGMVYTTATGAYTPSVIKIGNTYYMYYWNCVVGAGTKIEYATSSDGITWAYGGVIFAMSLATDFDYLDGTSLLIDPWVIQNRQGYYEMVYTAASVPNDSVPQCLCYAVSWDGITWFKRQVVMLEKNGAGWESGYLGDPVLLELPDGSANLYYCGVKGWPGDSYDGGLVTMGALV